MIVTSIGVSLLIYFVAYGFIGLWTVTQVALNLLSFGTAFNSLVAVTLVRREIADLLRDVLTRRTLLHGKVHDLINSVIPRNVITVEGFWFRLRTVIEVLDEEIAFSEVRGLVILFYISIWTMIILPLVKSLAKVIISLFIALFLALAWGFYDDTGELTLRLVLSGLRWYSSKKLTIRVNPTVDAWIGDRLRDLKYNRNMLFIWFYRTGIELNFILDRHATVVDESPENLKRRFMGVLRSGIMRFSKRINEFDVPAFIRRHSENRLDEHETLALAGDLGYPLEKLVIRKPLKGVAGGRYDRNLVFGTNWSFPQPKYRETVARELRGLRSDLEVWRHSYVWPNIDDQLEATARYFGESKSHPVFSDWELDQVWDTLKPIYRNSRIAPFKLVLDAWNKRYNVGAFAFSSKTYKNGMFKRMKRREDIARLGGEKGYLKYWENLFYYAPIMQHFSHFMTKSEYLPEKKWKDRKVRTPIASWLPQYLSQIVFSYVPNHNFRYEDTPVKVGMPLNGAVMGQMFEKHLCLRTHYAGDCSAFDSTITAPVVEIIKAIRKRGYEGHAQYTAICDLVDVSYDNLLHSKLVSAQTGNVYRREDHGLGTGHASTSADNSLVMVALYILAWARLTKLSAHEFRRHNELSVYGDDHVLSISEMAPVNWNFKNVQAVLAGWGITMNLEVGNFESGSPFEKTPFLSKFARRPTVVDREECMAALGFVPNIIVTHDVEKLLAKALSPNIRSNPADRMERFLSMIRLTAHRPDAYQIFHTAIIRLAQEHQELAVKAARIPAYDLVLQQWYNPKSNVSEDVEMNADDPPIEGTLIHHIGEWTMLDAVTAFLAIVPDVVNPRLYNIGYVNYLFRKSEPLLLWPKHLVAISNGLVHQGGLLGALRASSYDWIPCEGQLPPRRESTGTLLVRHWAYMALRMKFSFSWFGILDTVQRKIWDMNFLMNGKIPSQAKKLDLNLVNFSLVVALNFVKVPEHWFWDVILEKEFPRLDLLIKKFWTNLVNRLWSFIPPAFKNLKAVLHIERGKLVLITSPTGSGKSTSMVNFLASSIEEGGFEKLIVVEPRSLLVKGLVTYMNREFSDHFYSGATTGLALDDRAKVWYITPQELFLNTGKFLNPNWLYLVDEAHLPEIHIKACLEYLPMRGCLTLAATATPSPYLADRSDFEIALDLPNVYKVFEMSRIIRASNSKEVKDAYISEVLALVNSEDKVFSTWLIFCPKLSYVDILVGVLGGKSQGIVKGTGSVVPGCKYYIATSVADVGLTIPEVDKVVSLSFKPTRDHPTSQLWTQMDRQTMTQRKGRTGRTNNGIFYSVGVLGLDLVEEPPLTQFEICTQFCDTGGNLETLLELGWIDLKTIFEDAEADFDVSSIKRIFSLIVADGQQDSLAIFGTPSPELYKQVFPEERGDILYSGIYDTRKFGTRWGDRYFIYELRDMAKMLDMASLASFLERKSGERREAGLNPKFSWAEITTLVFTEFVLIGMEF
ncbi:RNA-dependent RNA polymerase [Morchella importuna fusarivirus 1]|uniref:RNA-dependent RNA polymerase n=1 Tax=Morchella importuna fusarivirus 1 TaxID=2501218 RepID=A0A3T0D236_9VIRU|nr:RNA-dependent RNA polymerase [Morchella importuna fusarivirus 1]